MPKRIPPARLYRDAVRQACVCYQAPPGADPDRAFRTYLEQAYREAKVRLCRFQAEGASTLEVSAARAALFVFAAGLLAFGRLDVVEDLLGEVPLGRGQIRRLAGTLPALVPLPKGLDPVRNAVSVQKWLRANRSNLRWDEAAGSYALDEPGRATQ